MMKTCCTCLYAKYIGSMQDFVDTKFYYQALWSGVDVVSSFSNNCVGFMLKSRPTELVADDRFFGTH